MILEELIETLASTLQSRVLALFGHPIERVILQAPPRLAMGDLATPLALELARALKKPPRQIAETIAKDLELPPLVRSVSVEGAGYLNFRIDRGLFAATFLRRVDDRVADRHERIIVEHTNINPNKAAHIGHIRNAVLGDTLVRSLQWLGYTVETQNYIDDTGVQVADVVVGFERVLGENVEQVNRRIDDSQTKFDYFCWDLYSKTVAEYAANPERREWQRETLHRIEKQEGETAKLASVVAHAVVRRHLATMLRLGIEYDLLVKESDIIQLHFWDRAFELLKKSGAVIYEESGKHAGCWVMKLSESAEFEGLEEPDKILVRSNGTVTYVGKDIAYQLWKFGLLDRTFGYQKFLTYEDGRELWESTGPDRGNAGAPHFGGAKRVINVIDNRQSYLQKIVKEGLQQLGHAEAAGNSVHFSYEMVALSPATATALGMNVSVEDASKSYLEMSGRKGLGVKADDLIDMLEQKAFEAVTAPGADGAEARVTDREEARELATKIAIGALRYFMLKYGRNKVIAFDFAEALTFEGDSGPYLQYSTVRVENIFRKMSERSVSTYLDDPSIDRLTISGEMPDEMWEIVRQAADLSGIVARAVESLEFSMITHYALELAQKFNSFYHKFPIVSETDADERQRRAACAEIFRRSMHQMLGILGIPLPAKM